MRARETRILLDCFLISVDRFFKRAQSSKRDTQIVIRPREMLALGDGRAIRLDRVGQIAPSRKRASECVVRFGIDGLALERRARFGYRFFELA